MTPTPTRPRLAGVMEEVAAILRKHGEDSWAGRIEDDLYFVAQGDAYGAQRFLSYFGGMGS